ncbi:IclR family transcriptional regulator [Candidatus Atribacteria bacterium HGW-Atribacteria-1]|nr:MAG: IclR family transcriptional regulator [Candidatus Atribacteria bacterium HGW-Atribacteria-1]
MSKKRSDYYIQSIKRAVQILNSFTLKEDELGVTELSERLNLHKSTIHRVLVTLEDESLVIKNQITQKYRLGIKLFELGHIVQDQMEIRAYALPIMKELAQKTEESIDLNILSDGKRVSIEKIESPHDVRRIIQLGKSLPLYCGGSGKALLAFLPDEEIDKVLHKEELIPLGPNTITNPVQLKEHLKEIRRKGYATSFEERILGSASIAAPILNYRGEVIASLSISGPITRFSKQKISKFVSLLKEAVSEISTSFGYPKTIIKF